MKRLLPVLALVVLLTGCTAAQPATDASAPTASVAAEPTPTPTPTPEKIVYTTEQAADAYLGGVCPANIAVQDYNNSFNAVAALGEGADLQPLKDAATRLRDAEQSGAVAFSDPNVVWPENIRADITTIVGYWFRSLAELNAVIQSSDYAALQAVTFSVQSDEEKAAGPRIRTLLGLPLDTAQSCAGR